jgi:hypothetical protein
VHFEFNQVFAEDGLLHGKGCAYSSTFDGITEMKESMLKASKPTRLPGVPGACVQCGEFR